MAVCGGPGQRYRWAPGEGALDTSCTHRRVVDIHVLSGQKFLYDERVPSANRFEQGMCLIQGDLQGAPGGKRFPQGRSASRDELAHLGALHDSSCINVCVKVGDELLDQCLVVGPDCCDEFHGCQVASTVSRAC